MDADGSARARVLRVQVSSAIGREYTRSPKSNGFAWKKKKKKNKHPASWKNERKIGVHIGWTHPFRVFPCARTINGIGRICIISTCLPYKNIEMGKRKRMVCFWAHREWCVRLKVSCVHRLTLDRQFFFFFSTYLLRLQRMRKEKGLRVCDTNVAIVSNFLPLSSKCGNRGKGGHN